MHQQHLSLRLTSGLTSALQRFLFAQGSLPESVIMPFFRTSGKLVYYAHVPKCGGSSIANYVADRFGPLAFHELRYRNRPEAERWTRTSPQHIDVVTLERLLPPSMFDMIFAVVRHPVQRLISIYHFQLEIEQSIPVGMDFSSWLAGLRPNDPDHPFAYDNHARPMTQIVPEGATVFYLEHGLDPLIGWFDMIAGNPNGPRAILPENRRGDFGKPQGPRTTASAADIARIGELYADDFARFGYTLTDSAPAAAAPVLSAKFMAERDRALAAAQSPFALFRRKLRRRLARL
jgi:hypothetical protein